jgi:hypothetical protein
VGGCIRKARLSSRATTNNVREARGEGKEWEEAGGESTMGRDPSRKPGPTSPLATGSRRHSRTRAARGEGTSPIRHQATATRRATKHPTPALSSCGLRPRPRMCVDQGPGLTTNNPVSNGNGMPY